MRIGLVTHYMPPHMGGIERAAESLCRGYQLSGHAVRWVASRAPSSAARREDFRIRVGCWNVLERWFGVPLPIWGLEAWRAVNALARWADVLHVHDCLYPGSVLGVALGRRHGTPVVLSQHQGPVGYENGVLRLLERTGYSTLGRIVLGQASYIVYASPAAETYVPSLLRYGPRRACSIPPGIDLTVFEPRSPSRRDAARARLGLGADARVVLFAGRLVEKKGLPLILEVSRRLPAVRFLVIGNGPLSHLLSDPGENLTWLPAVEHAQMCEYYHASDCLLLPSRGEGLPLVVQEAMACGLPVIVSAEAFTEATNRLLADPPAGLSHRSRLYAQAHWDITRVAQRYVAVFEELGCALG